MPLWGYGTVAHVLNWALRKGRIVASTIHNQRYVCANGLFWRNNEECFQCFHSQNPLWGAVYNCRENTMESLSYASAISSAWMRNVYNHPTHRLIALNQKTAERLRKLFPCAPVVQIPNVVNQNTEESDSFSLPAWKGKKIAVVGRLSFEKGMQRLINAIRWGSEKDGLTSDPSVRFIFAGDGPMRSLIEEEAKVNERVLYLGKISEKEVRSLLQSSDGYFFSSIVEEQSPTVLRQAATLNIPLYSWDGRIKPQEVVAQWGSPLTARQWVDAFLKL